MFDAFFLCLPGPGVCRALKQGEEGPKEAKAVPAIVKHSHFREQNKTHKTVSKQKIIQDKQ